MLLSAPVRPENAAQTGLLGILRDDGPRSLAELVDVADLSRARVAGEVDRLVEIGLVERAGPSASRGGRRSTMMQLASDLRYLGVDIGATSIDVAVSDGELRILDRVAVDMDVRRGPEAVLAIVEDLAAQLSKRHDGRLQAAGVGVPGPVSFRDGMPVSPPIMPGWDRFPVRDSLAAAWSGIPVVVDNDVNVMALGEHHAGVARGVDDFLFVKIGTGIGCGILLRGEVYRGVSGSAGDIGHVRVEEYGPVCACGNTGCLESFFGGAALARDALALAKAGRSEQLAAVLHEREALTAVDVGRAAAAGDPVSRQLIRDGGRRLGEVIATLASFINPGMVVIGGGVAQLGHGMLAEVRSVVYRRCAPLAIGNLPIVLSELGAEAGVLGSARLASDRHLRRKP